jgi:hypothetical protein
LAPTPVRSSTAKVGPHIVDYSQKEGVVQNGQVAPPNAASREKFIYEFPYRAADFAGRVLLDEMDALNAHFVLVWPAAAEIAATSDKQRTGFGINEQFWKSTSRKPFSIVVDDLDNVGRRAIDRQLARPHQRRDARFTILKRCADLTGGPETLNRARPENPPIAAVGRSPPCKRLPGLFLDGETPSRSPGRSPNRALQEQYWSGSRH